MLRRRLARAAQRGLTALPAEDQDRLIRWTLRTGLARRTPLLSMLLRTLEYEGLDLAEVHAAFRQASPGQRIHEVLRDLGRRTAATAEHTLGDAARTGLLRAAQATLLGDLFAPDETTSRAIYDEALPWFDAYRSRCVPPVTKLAIPWEGGPLAAHLRVPPSPGPWPLLLIVPGTDTVKERMVVYEEAALARGLASLTVDLPGCGESKLQGTRWRTLDDLRTASAAILDTLGGLPPWADAGSACSASASAGS